MDLPNIVNELLYYCKQMKNISKDYIHSYYINESSVIKKLSADNGAMYV